VIAWLLLIATFALAVLFYFGVQAFAEILNKEEEE
jgi:hypothetical protein